MSKCIQFIGYKDKDGYGQRRHKGKKCKAHRLAYCIYHNIAIEGIKGEVVRHTCDNPSCINPEHLKIGTHQDNMDDKVKRTRQSRGCSHGRAVLTDENVHYIREVYVVYHRVYGASALARQFGVTSSTIDKIVHNKLWKHIGKDDD